MCMYSHASHEEYSKTSCSLYFSKPYSIFGFSFFKMLFREIVHLFIQHNYEMLQYATNCGTCWGTQLLTRQTRSLPTEQSLM